MKELFFGDAKVVKKILSAKSKTKQGAECEISLFLNSLLNYK
jgi:hypothetical protein